MGTNEQKTQPRGRVSLNREGRFCQIGRIKTIGNYGRPLRLAYETGRHTRWSASPNPSLSHLMLHTTTSKIQVSSLDRKETLE